MRVITSMHKGGFEKYGEQMLLTFEEYWPDDIELVCYAEGCVEEVEALGTRATAVWPDWKDLKIFKSKLPPPGSVRYKVDAGRFAPKGWAIWDGLRAYHGTGLWLDADVITTAPVTHDWLSRVIRPDVYLTFVGRDGLRIPYTETGFLAFDCEHPWHRRFMDAFLDYWRKGDIVLLKEWHDCYVLDACRKRFKLKERDLNIAREWEHPFNRSILGERLDHLKGPMRKEVGISEGVAHASV